MDIHALYDQRAKLHAKLQDLVADGDKRGEWTTEGDDSDDAKFKKIKAEVDATDAAIERAKILQDSERRMAVRPPPVSAELNPRQKQDLAGDPAPATNASVKENVLDDPKKGFKSPREFLMCVMDAGRGRMDPRLKILATAGSDEQGEYSDPYGGFLVPAGFSPDLLKIQAEVDPLMGRTTMVPMSNPTITIPARTDKTHTSSVSGGLQAYWRSETQTQPATRMETEQIRLVANSLYGLAYATEELLTDSPISFVAILEAGFRDEFASRMLDARLNGTGTGQPEGVVTAACTISVAKETGQAAATIVFENLIKMRSRCWGYGNAVWLYNHDCLPTLMQTQVAVGTGGVPAWQMGAREDRPDMILGRPAFPTEYTATVGTVGDIVLGNWSQYLEADYQPLQSAESVHVRFANNERTFRFTARKDGKPWWLSALTPKTSTTTLSPFVTLATRA